MASPRTYLDHVASTPMDPAAREAMARALESLPGNPGSPHREGRAAKDALEEARSRVAAALACRPREVVFTSGATEACQLALRGAATARRERSDRVVVSAAEHVAVREGAEMLAAAGFRAFAAPIDAEGRLTAEAFLEAVGPEAAVAALLLASHETGAVMPVAEVARGLGERGIPLLCDAALGPGRLPARVADLGADLVALSGHKFGGPPATGVLYVRRRTRLERILSGGVQEERLRPGRENVAGAIALSVALERAVDGRSERAARYRALEAAFLGALGPSGAWRRLGPPDGLPGLVALEVPGVEGEAAMINLDLDGFAVGTGSTCSLGGTERSPGLLALGLTPQRAASTLRVSFGEGNTAEEAARAGAALGRVLERLRALARR